MTISGRRALTIGFAVAGGVAAIVLVLIPRSSSPHHSPVYRYITSVDAAEARMTYSLSKVQAAYQAVTVRHSMSPATAKAFAAAVPILRTVEMRIARIPAPPQASQLRTLVLRLVRQEIAATREIGSFVRFLPSFDAVLRALGTAAKRLGHDLAAAKAPTPQKLHGTAAQIEQAQAAFAAAATKAALAQADAVAAYDTAVAKARARLRALSPPSVMEPAYRYQLEALVRTSAAGARLAAGLRAPTRTSIPALSRAFAAASRTSQTVAAQRAEVAAVKAYNARLRAVGTTAVDIRREITKLQAHEH